MVYHDLSVVFGQVITIGDDYQADVLDDLQNGIRAIWYNPFRIPLPDDKKVMEFDDF